MCSEDNWGHVCSILGSLDTHCCSNIFPILSSCYACNKLLHVLCWYFISLAMSYGYILNDEFCEYETEICIPLVADYCLQRFSVLSWDIKVTHTSRLHMKYNPLTVRYDTIAIGWHTYHFDFSLFELNCTNFCQTVKWNCILLLLNHCNVQFWSLKYPELLSFTMCIVWWKLLALHYSHRQVTGKDRASGWLFVRILVVSFTDP